MPQRHATPTAGAAIRAWFARRQVSPIFLYLQGFCVVLPAIAAEAVIFRPSMQKYCFAGILWLGGPPGRFPDGYWIQVLKRREYLRQETWLGRYALNNLVRYM
jgi:hypothetical protein